MQIVWKDHTSEKTYDRARWNNVFNLERPNCFPRAMISATGTEDVVSAIKLAAQQEKCQVAVRSGGHSMFVWSLHEDSMLIDLGNWKEITVDADAKIARVTTSVTGLELSRYLRTKHQLFFPTGHCPDVAIGGFLLQGGQGWNCRNWGYACDLLVGVEIVTAEGDVLFCNQHENQDLYWAARGAGPLFPAVVTKFHLQLLPDPTTGLRSSGYIYPAKMYRQAFEWVQSVIPNADQDTEIVMVAFYSEARDEVCFKVHFVTMKADAVAAEHALKQLHQGRPPGAITEWISQEDSLDHLFDDQRMANPPSHYYYTDNSFISNEVDVTGVLEESFLTLPPGKSFAFWYPMYPRSRRSGSDMALRVPSDHYFSMYAIAEDREDVTRCKMWVERTMEKIRESAVGSYLGECDLKLPHNWYWAKDTVQRLTAIRQKWDPRGLFCTVHGDPGGQGVETILQEGR
ncbi:FAD-binding domain-containing protein [Aspergillus bertholletiae]|uniref:FAD-binding domain-containing protein n=1 Tax=Aspergillus bertholletiae TaxID=1226010 RepID=A0A5N7BMT4_9EURO|nr:FAD-binding domain-containing protein [Aspergillus bertholletiae]